MLKFQRYIQIPPKFKIYLAFSLYYVQKLTYSFFFPPQFHSYSEPERKPHFLSFPLKGKIRKLSSFNRIRFLAEFILSLLKGAK